MHNNHVIDFYAFQVNEIKVIVKGERNIIMCRKHEKEAKPLQAKMTFEVAKQHMWVLPQVAVDKCLKSIEDANDPLYR